MIAPTRPAQRPEVSTVRRFRQVFQRNRWLFFATPLLTLAGTLLFITLVTPVYEGLTSIRIDQERSNLAVLDALQELSTGSEIHTEMGELRSRSLAEAVVDSLDLNVELQQPKRVSRGALFSELRASRTAAAAIYRLTRTGDDTFELEATPKRTVRIGERVQLRGLSFVLAPAAARHETIALRVRDFPLAVRTFSAKLGIGRPDREANILNIRYEGTDRTLVQAVPNQVAAQFIARRDDVRKTQARSTVNFLSGQIDTLGAQLARTETGMLAFREHERVVDPKVEAESQLRELAELQAKRDQIEAERGAIAAIAADLGREPDAHRRLLGYPSLLAYPAAAELLSSLNELENERSKLLVRRTEADSEVVILGNRIRSVDAELKGLTTTYVAGLQRNVSAMDAVLARFSADLARIPAKEMQLARLRRQAKVTEDIFTALQTRLKEAQIAANVEDPSVRIVDAAPLPYKPIRPNKPLSVALALLLGSILGAALAFAREQLNTTIRTREELLELGVGVPVLGQVPRITAGVEPRWRLPFFVTTNGGTAAADFGAGPHGAVAEAYRTLRTNIAFTQPDAPPKVIVVTSALPGDGKSTSALNLAITLAQQGLRVLLIDGDMRRGALNEKFGVKAEPGLSNVLLGRFAPTDAVQTVTAAGTSLALIATGTLPPNPAELLASARVTQMLEELKPEFDAIVIDSPPLNIVTDAAIIGSRADGVLLVARSGATDRDAYRFALEQLESVHARLLGCILNDVDTKGDTYYGRRGAGEYYTARVHQG